MTARGKFTIRMATVGGNEGLPEKRYRTVDKLARFMIMDCPGKISSVEKTTPWSAAFIPHFHNNYQIDCGKLTIILNNFYNCPIFVFKWKLLQKFLLNKINQIGEKINGYY